MTDREPVNIMGVIAFPEPDKSKRRIRFIDAEYNTLFYIPDGASIVMTRMDGSSVIWSCTYIHNPPVPDYTLPDLPYEFRTLDDYTLLEDDYEIEKT